MKPKAGKKMFIFVCNKCNHNLYVDKQEVKKLLDMECPSCGEEADELWTLSREGIWKEPKP